MATTTNITTTYAGEFAGEYIAAALLSAPTLDQEGVTIKPNVKYKEVIKTYAIDDIVKDGTCDFTDTSTLTLAEQILEPETFQVNLELCKADFRSDWEAASMGYSAHDNLPPKFSDFMVAHTAEKVAQKIEKNVWQGSNLLTGEFAGFLELLSGDASVIDVTATTVDASNVIAELGKVADAIPSTIYGKEDLNIYVPQNVARAYVRALGGYAANGVGAAGTNDAGTQWFAGRGVGNIGLSFDGINLFVADGLPSNRMVAAQKSNLFFGTGLLSDHNEVKVLDMADLDGSQNVRVIMRFTGAVQYGIGSDIVLYS